MTTVSGILDLPAQGAEGRIRQLDGCLVEDRDDPFVPLSLADTYALRQGQRLTVNVSQQRSRPVQHDSTTVAR